MFISRRNISTFKPYPALAILAALFLSACSSGSSGPEEEAGPVTTECTEANPCDMENMGDMGEAEDDVVNLPPIIRPAIPADQREPLGYDDSYVYQSTSFYREVLRDCYIADLENACDLDTLPFIGMSAFNPSVDSIMARTIVTHDWMGLRFSQFLARLPEEALEFFKPVTVIYIGSDIIFNSFDATQGKLEIAGDGLWLTFGEKSTAFFTFEPTDTGTDTGTDNEPTPTARDGLQFRVAGRLMQDDIWLSSKGFQDERQFEDIFPFFAYSIYRNAAFAFDRLGVPSSSNTALSETPFDVFARSDFPLLDGMVNNPAFTNTASGLFRYAELYYGDINDATIAEQQATASFIGNLFAIDGRLELFSYFSVNADFMDLFAAGMMRYKHGVHVDFAVLEPNDNACDRQIAYGVSNRAASLTVVPRLRYVMEAILGQSTELSEFFDAGLGVAEDLPAGVSWCDSVPDPVSAAINFSPADELFRHGTSTLH